MSCNYDKEQISFCHLVPDDRINLRGLHTNLTDVVFLLS